MSLTRPDPAIGAIQGKQYYQPRETSSTSPAQANSTPVPSILTDIEMKLESEFRSIVDRIDLLISLLK